MDDKLKAISEALWKNPTEKNWGEFAKALPKSSARYYKVMFEKGKLANKEGLRDSYAQLYDKKQAPLYRVPIYKNERGRIRGATIYLRGLFNINK